MTNQMKITKSSKLTNDLMINRVGGEWVETRIMEISDVLVLNDPLLLFSV